VSPDFIDAALTALSIAVGLLASFPPPLLRPPV